jgi:hypothetical protein
MIWKPWLRCDLSMKQTELNRKSSVEIAKILCEEELKWYQWFKSKFILEGDSNTRYSHSVANDRNRKKSMHSPIRDEGITES